MELTTTSDQFGPLSVSISWDGQTTTGQFTGTRFQKNIAVGPMPLGPRSISITCTDPAGLRSTQTRSVLGRDGALPKLRVNSPQPSAKVVGDANGKVTVSMNGTAQDAQSGMIGGQAKVEWSLTPGGTRTLAAPVTATDFSNWRAEVALTGFGVHTIYLWATDNAGNAMPAPLQVPVEVISSYVPATLEQRLNERQYLAALLAFAQEQVTVPGTPPARLDTRELVRVLGQPLDRLSQPLSAADDPGSREINQLRVPVELLRARITATNTPTTPGAATERSYRDTAYASLLAAIGTSYAELRLARGAAPAVRQALAARLGIRLSPTSPDELDRLILDDARLTEAALETYFGLRDSTKPDPLRDPPTALLLSWRLAGQRVSWAEQDQHPSPPRAFAVLADPDVIGPSDVATVPDGEPIRRLLATRATDLTAYARMLDGIRAAAPNAASGLAQMEARALPGVDLADLEAKEKTGVDISAALESAGLSRRGFLYLLGLAQLANAGTVSPAEWSDAIAVLTGARKRSLYPTWRSEEKKFVLSPDFFVLADPGPQVNALRVDSRARTDWQAVLRRRIAQRQDLIEGSARAIAEAEAMALPLLRDALLADLAPSTAGDVGEEMSTLFLVDVKASGRLRTTRLRQAIESVQSLLSAKRSGELPATHPAFAWKLDKLDEFTAGWVWMGELGSWRAATMDFLFPERHLDPTLLVPNANATPPLPIDAFWYDVRGSGPFSTGNAYKAATDYVNRMKKGFAYIDPHRSQSHQNELKAISSSLDAKTAREMFWVVPLILAQRLHSAGDYRAALDWYWILYPYDDSTSVSIYHRIGTEREFRPDLTFPPSWTTKLNPFDLAENRPFPYTRYTLLSIIRCHIDYADAEFTRETDESIANARLLYSTARRLLGARQLRPLQPTNPGEPTLAIPELEPLRRRAEMQLIKLRQGRNIAGMPRTQGTATIATVSQPTPFRFKTLLERAKQLTAQAAQIEAGYLAALEKYDQKNLQLYDALKAIDLSASQITLAASRVREANDAVTAAQAQKNKANAMLTAYGNAIAAPPNRYETALLAEYSTMRDIKDRIVAVDTAIGIAQAASNAASLSDQIFSGGAKAALAIGISAGLVVKGGLESWQNDVELQMQANSLQAGIEQRRNEWRLQRTSAQQEYLVAAAQVTVANDQVTIAIQEQAIATLQHDQAVATLKFLNDQFTNADLYWWMSNTLGGVYRYFLQQATATARLAQAQLAFERAESAQVLIRNDYWQLPAQGMTANTTQIDRRGLTGAERLSEDLTRLDQYALSSDRRRLNLSQTFSLARLMPVEFLEFRRTGTIQFATPMSMFDADFPGHYLRQIRQVRTSIVALLPPDRGIRATLYSNGISRVATGADGTFQDIVVRHDPTAVALTSPVNASGVFELDAQADMLLPFESSGVDTTWELQLPPAANPFDFSTIVDVLLTIEYTALSDWGYRSEVINRLNGNRERGADCVFSLARDFPDLWYDLNNSANPAIRSATITLRDIDFPVAIEAISTAAIAIRLVSAGTVPNTVVSLHRGPAGGEATATNGIASTRRGNAPNWGALCGSSPVGDWQLSFGSDAAPLFAAGALTDVLLVISWTGQAPEWAA